MLIHSRFVGTSAYIAVSLTARYSTVTANLTFRMNVIRYFALLAEE